MSHDLSLAQSHAFQLSRGLMVPVTVFEVDGEYGVLPLTRSTPTMTSRSFTNSSLGWLIESPSFGLWVVPAAACERQAAREAAPRPAIAWHALGAVSSNAFIANRLEHAFTALFVPCSDAINLGEVQGRHEARPSAATTACSRNRFLPRAPAQPMFSTMGGICTTVGSVTPESIMLNTASSILGTSCRIISIWSPSMATKGSQSKQPSCGIRSA
jgi:hypothetical protein